MAAFNFVAAAVSYFAIGALTNDPTAAFAAAVVFTGIMTFAFGRLFTERIAAPVDAANFAAKSSERNPSGVFPAATGVSETDDILHSIHRSNRQLLSFASLMETVAAGNTANVAMPLDSPDKLTASFQKLVQKVAESVNAKQDLEELLRGVKELEDQLGGLLETRPYREVRSSLALVRIAEALNELAARGDREMRAARSQISGAEPLLLSANLSVRNGLAASEASLQGLSRTVSLLKAMPDHVKTIAEICEPANSAAEKAAATLHDGMKAGESLASKLELIQRYQNDLNRKLRKLRDHSQSIAEAARSVEDLSRRSNLIALNTSIQADNRSDSIAITNEFRTLSDRAQRAQKEIIEIERSISQEIDDTDSILRFLTAESAEVSIQLSTLLELAENFEPVLNGLSGVPERIRELNNKSKSEREDLTRAITACYFDLEKIAPQLRETEHALAAVRSALEDVTPGTHFDKSLTKDSFDSPSPADRPTLELSGEN